MYLTLREGRWTVDPGDGYPLDGLEDGPQCVNGVDGDHGRSCTAVKNVPELPTLWELYTLIGHLASPPCEPLRPARNASSFR